jgi:hypothetical protein
VLRQGLRIDVLYHIWFVQPFQRLVALLSGDTGHTPDAFGAAPVALILWLKRQLVDRFRRDGFDRGWMALAGTATPLWAIARRSQTGLARHSVMALAGGAAALLALAWVTT